MLGWLVCVRVCAAGFGYVVTTGEGSAFADGDKF